MPLEMPAADLRNAFTIPATLSASDTLQLDSRKRVKSESMKTVTCMHMVTMFSLLRLRQRWKQTLWSLTEAGTRKTRSD